MFYENKADEHINGLVGSALIFLGIKMGLKEQTA